MALRTMCGRKVILTDVQTIDETNVVSVLRKALVTHLSNKMDIEYLWKYKQVQDSCTTVSANV